MKKATTMNNKEEIEESIRIFQKNKIKRVISEVVDFTLLNIYIYI